jgi:hypothetical protein
MHIQADVAKDVRAHLLSETARADAAEQRLLQEAAATLQATSHAEQLSTELTRWEAQAHAYQQRVQEQSTQVRVFEKRQGDGRGVRVSIGKFGMPGCVVVVPVAP